MWASALQNYCAVTEQADRPTSIEPKARWDYLATNPKRRMTKGGRTAGIPRASYGVCFKAHERKRLLGRASQ